MLPILAIVEKTWGGGLHFKPGYRFRIHQVPLVTIHRGQIGYVFARDGQTLGRAVEADFTDCRAWLAAGGQQGPQRAILREGTYAINLAQFVVICGPKEIYYHPVGGRDENAAILRIAETIAAQNGFAPVLIDGAMDQIGIVTVQGDPSLRQGDIIASCRKESRAWQGRTRISR